jgi:AAA+ superfamily predicted ATPase
VITFAELDARIRAGVEQVSATTDGSRDPFAGMYVTDEQAKALASENPPSAVDARLDELSELLGLDSLERAVLAVCAAPELSWRYSRLYGYLHDDLTRQLASPRLAAALLAGGEIGGEDVFARCDAEAPLRRLGAIVLLDEPRLPLADRPLKCADGVAARLAGGIAPNHDDAPGELVDVPALAPIPEEVAGRLDAVIAASGDTAVAVVGADAASAIASAIGRAVLLVRARSIDGTARMSALRLRAALERAVVAIEGLYELLPEERAELWRVIGTASERPIVCVEPAHEGAALGQVPVIVVRVPANDGAGRRRQWSLRAPGAQIDDVAVKFRLSSEQIARAARIAAVQATARGATTPSPADLDYGARAASRHALGGLAIQVEGDFASDDLIIPEKGRRALSLISAFLRHRDRVLFDWGYARTTGSSPGMTVLFAGESGTGKTMAAQVVANELGLELFRIDLATVVSKFIGETEKQLDRIFTAAAGSNAILLFDEADALFGKRSEVQDAHDRYANVEVAYLLQRIERYDGAVILTTNLRHNIDKAFLRRLDLVVDFPFPDEGDRARLWHRLLPAKAPVDELDIDFLAGRFKLSGGSIRNVTVAAAVLAAADGGRITMEHLARGIALEYEKLGRLTLESDFERFYDAVRADGRPAG